MKFTLPWLMEHLDGPGELEEIVEALTNLGLEVDAVEDRSDLDGFVVAEIAECVPHPNAERLSLLEVNWGEGRSQVVCGAPNARAGFRGVFAKPGSVIPSTGAALKPAEIRGVASSGMMCSARELKLGEEHDGILELASEAEIGAPATRWLGLEGPVITVDLTPDRADCFGVRGIARDLAAAGLGKLRAARDMSPVASQGPKGPAIRLDFAPDRGPAPCSFFAGRIVRGVRNGPSPAWLQNRLRAIGLRPISALVDITNYATFDLGRPLHVFDAAKLRGDLTVRLAQPGEEIVALDGKTYRTDGEACVIADERGAVSIGGIIGGEETGCTDTTTDVVLEAALFDPLRIARVGRRLGIDSDAKTRFERGVDPEIVLPTIEWATRLIVELCGGEPGETEIAGALPEARAPIEFRADQLPRLAGVTIEASEIERILRDLGFAIEGGPERWSVRPPSWRRDVTCEACVVEELARVHGYDKVPPVSVTRPGGVAKVVVTDEQRRRSHVRRVLAERGLAEAVTWSFVEEALAERFGAAAPARLRNPMNAELAAMRPSLLPGLLGAAARNAARGIDAIALFELGQRFLGPRPGEQAIAAAGLRAGPFGPTHWSAPGRAADLYDAKADALAGLAAAGVKTDAVQVVSQAPDWYHPGRSGSIKLGPKTVLATFGELHPALLAEADAPKRAVAFEIDFEALPRQRKKPGRGREPFQRSPYPAVDRDFAFVVDADLPADQLLRAVKSADKTLIVKVELFDLYEGDALGEGKKSLAIAVRLQSQERTLEERDVAPIVEKIVAAAKKSCGAELRA